MSRNGSRLARNNRRETFIFLSALFEDPELKCTGQKDKERKKRQKRNGSPGHKSFNETAQRDQMRERSMHKLIPDRDGIHM